MNVPEQGADIPPMIPLLSDDDENCGAPGFRCPPGTHCHFGVCIPDEL